MELFGLQKEYAIPFLEKIENATIEERGAALTSFGAKPLDDIVSKSDDGTEATIKIVGPLSPAGPSPLARFFGYSGTGYVSIISAAKNLENDPSVTTVRLAMDTPGGTIASMDQARQALESLASKKNLIAENHGMIASAGYYLATAADSIVAMSPLAITGSIGVIRAGLDFSDAMARSGVKQIKIISSNAPNKQADPTTAQGLKVHQDEIDAMERVFIDKVAEGRNTTAKDVIENFGKGGILIAQDPDSDKPDALSVGMIDSVTASIIEPVIDNEDNGTTGNGDTINGVSDNAETIAAEGGQQQGIDMDLEKLKAEHPALYAQAVAIGMDQGVKNERERAEAHITMGEACGDMELAVSCIKDGAELTPAINAKYYAVGMNKKASGDRGSESENEIETEATETEAADALDKAVADQLASNMGVQV